jgi:hypothetical protein
VRKKKLVQSEQDEEIPKSALHKHRK